MSIIKGMINLSNINERNLLSPPNLDSTRIGDNQTGRRETHVERKMVQMNSKLRSMCLQTRFSTELDNKFVCHLFFGILNIPSYIIFGSDGAIVGLIKGHGHADIHYDYCLGLSALLTDIGTRYQDAQQFLVKIGK